MTILYPPANRTQQLLESARQKLLAPHVSPLLRMTAFLRISCAALEEPGAYSQLMQALFQHDREWWKTCEVTPEGMLSSSDPEIQWLLERVLKLHSSSPLLSVASNRSLSPLQSPVQV